MSWDIFVQDLPVEAVSVEDIPEDFQPRPIGTRPELISRITQVVPSADFSDPSWGTIEGPGYSIEVNIGHETEVDSFALHVRGSSDDAVAVVTTILDHLGLRALDSASGEFFDRNVAVASFHSWRNYRDQVVGGEATTDE
jgi:hypothetical protein